MAHPSVLTSLYIEDWMENNKAVQASVRRMFSWILNDSTIANDSSSNKRVYKLVSTILGISVTYYDGLPGAIDEITDPKLVASSGY